MNISFTNNDSVNVLFLSSILFFCFLNQSFARELITQDEAPYTYEEANWRAGNYMQALFLDYSSLPSLSENFIGKGKLPTDRFPDAFFPANTGLDLLAYCEEAIYTPVVRIELIKKIFKAIYGSHYRNADALWLVYSGGRRQLSSLSPAHKAGPSWNPAWEYPASKLVARNLPDTQSEMLALVWPHVQVNGKWYDDSHMKFEDLKYNVADKQEQSFTTESLYTSPEVGSVKIKGVGWEGLQDKVLELTLSMSADANRQKAQLVFSNLTDEGMGFSAPYPTEFPETIQLPDGSEISSKLWSVENPDYSYLIIYTKDVDRSGFEYQNAMMFGWREKPSKITVHWSDGSKSSLQEAYPGTEGTTDVMAGVYSGGYYRVDFEYDDKTDFQKTVWVERFQGVDPSLSLSHLHHIARTICATGHVGKPGYAGTESGWLEEPVCAFPAAAYVLAMFDEQEDPFGGDYSEEAVKIATKIVDDRIAMWKRGRKSSAFHEYASGAYYLSLLYNLPGRFNDPQKRDYYKKWVYTWADELVKDENSKLCSARHMMALWRAFELTADQKYAETFEKSRSAYRISEKEGLYKNDKWILPSDFYSYGDLMGALGRRGNPEDVSDIQKLISYLTNQNRWTDTGFMGVWWEVTIENHNFFGRWCKGLGMEGTPKRFITVSEFPVYYKKGEEVVIETPNIPMFYNPDYWDQEVMKKYLPLLPHKIAKSILFRIDTILLKTDYPLNWWVGTRVPSVITDLRTIQAHMQKILVFIDDNTASTSNGEATRKLLAECAEYFKSAAASIEGSANFKLSYTTNPTGNPVDLVGELSACQWNFEYLKTVLTEGH